MSEESQSPPEVGIDYTTFMYDKTVPGTIQLVDIPRPYRVDFGIDTLGQWRIEVRAEDGTLLDWADDGLGEEPADLSAYSADVRELPGLGDRAYCREVDQPAVPEGPAQNQYD